MSIPDLHEKYREGEPLTMLTAYDAPIAQQSTAAASTVTAVPVYRCERRRAVDIEMTYSRHYRGSSTGISPPRRAFTTRSRSDTSATNGEDYSGSKGFVGEASRVTPSMASKSESKAYR